MITEIESLREPFDTFVKSLPKEIRPRANQAFKLAFEAHKLQYRRSGEPYLTHPIAVAINLWNVYQNEDLLIAGLLHDVVEDANSIKIEDIYEQFGSEIGFIIDALNKKSLTFYEYPEKKFSDRWERILYAGDKNFKVYLVKLADREHNLMSLSAFRPSKQVRISFETQAIYEPLKRIVSFKTETDLDKAEKMCRDFFSKNGASNYLDRKNFLMKQTFMGLSDSLFALIQEEAENVVWSLNDYDLFVKLTEIDYISDKISLIKLAYKPELFRADFRLVSAFRFDTDLKIEAQSFGY